MELKEGMYVRFNNGIIAKCVKNVNNYYSFDNELDSYGTMIIENGNVNDEYFFKNFKSSYNIIDLIEVGDYVNGFLVKEVRREIIGLGVIIFDNGISIWEQNIRSIVTKEQFESMSYKVGE